MPVVCLFQVGDVVEVVPIATSEPVTEASPVFKVTEVIPGYIGWHRYRLCCRADGREVIAHEPELLLMERGEDAGV